jgi:hypothetical protein
MTTKRMWAVLACSTLSGGHAIGQVAQVFFQVVDDGDIRPLTPEEKQGLQDPFFQLVLKDNPGAVKLSDIEGLLQPDATQRRTFVLDEEIRDPALGQSRRMVLAFDGTNGGIKLDSNVMVSVFFDSDAIPEVSRLEAWGWDDATPPDYENPLRQAGAKVSIGWVDFCSAIIEPRREQSGDRAHASPTRVMHRARAELNAPSDSNEHPTNMGYKSQARHSGSPPAGALPAHFIS